MITLMVSKAEERRFIASINGISTEKLVIARDSLIELAHIQKEPLADNNLFMSIVMELDRRRIGNK